MDEVKIKLSAVGKGQFYIKAGDKKIAEMIISVSGNELTVYHTEVLPEFEGKGVAKELLHAMVLYARNNHLKVIALCPFVHAEFRRHPGEYNDIWKK